MTWPVAKQPRRILSFPAAGFWYESKNNLQLAGTCNFGAERGEEIRLWMNGAPGSEGETAQEVFRASNNPKLPAQFSVVHYPSIYVFLPPREKANGAAVVIAPGCGHSQLVIGKEGWEIADWLNANGFAAFVLKYRLAKASGSKYTVEAHALADTARVMTKMYYEILSWDHVSP